MLISQRPLNTQKGTTAMPIDTLKTGAAIAACRQQKNLSQQGLAGLMNVTHQAVSKWEKGQALPDTETLLALSKLFGVSMEALLTGPAVTTGLRSAIPEGTRLLSWSVKGDLAKLDLSEPYDTLEGVALTLADYCITLTLTQLENVKNVHITVNGRDVSRRGKQIFSASDVVLSGAEEEPVELTAALCFRRIGGNELGEELRVFRLTESQSATLAVLQALLAGPTEPGLQALLPQGVEVYSARVEAGVCYADFSAALLTDVPVSLEQQRLVLHSIVESLQSLGHVQAVQILVEGEPLSDYGQVDVSQPLS